MSRFAFSLRDTLALVLVAGMILASFRAGVLEGRMQVLTGRGLPSNFFEESHQNPTRQ